MKMGAVSTGLDTRTASASRPIISTNFRGRYDETVPYYYLLLIEWGDFKVFALGRICRRVWQTILFRSNQTSNDALLPASFVSGIFSTPDARTAFPLLQLIADVMHVFKLLISFVRNRMLLEEIAEQLSLRNAVFTRRLRTHALACVLLPIWLQVVRRVRCCFVRPRNNSASHVRKLGMIC